MANYIKYEVRRPKDGKLLGFLSATDPLDANNRPYIGFQTMKPLDVRGMGAHDPIDWEKEAFLPRTQTVRLERMDVGARVPFGAPLTIPTLWLVEGKQSWLTRMRAFTRR